MGNNEPAVDQSDFRIRDSYGLKLYTSSGAHEWVARSVQLCIYICLILKVF